MRVRSLQSGITLIEVLVAVTVLSVALIFIGYTITVFVTARDEMQYDLKALYLAEEGYELLRAIRTDDWNTLDVLALDTEYALQVSTTTLAVGSPPEIIDGEFNRVFELRSLYRDSDGDVVASTTPGASSDSEGREVWISVGGPAGTSTVRAIITNLFAQ